MYVRRKVKDADHPSSPLIEASLKEEEERSNCKEVIANLELGAKRYHTVGDSKKIMKRKAGSRKRRHW